MHRLSFSNFKKELSSNEAPVRSNTSYPERRPLEQVSCWKEDCCHPHHSEYEKPDQAYTKTRSPALGFSTELRFAVFEECVMLTSLQTKVNYRVSATLNCNQIQVELATGFGVEYIKEGTVSDLDVLISER